MRWLASYIMTTANPYVCSDVSSSNDISVPYCDSEDDTEYHNGFGSDAWIDDMHLEGRFQDQLRVEHDTTHPEKKHLEEHFATWKKTNHVHVKKMRKEFIEKHRETQKSGHTAAGKKAHKKKKDNKGHAKMSKFESEFVTLNNTWKDMSYHLYHKAWTETRKILAMEENDMKLKLREEYLLKYETSPMIKNYLSDDSTFFITIDPEETFKNLIARMKSLHKERKEAAMMQNEISGAKNVKNMTAITGGK